MRQIYTDDEYSVIEGDCGETISVVSAFAPDTTLVIRSDRVLSSGHQAVIYSSYSYMKDRVIVTGRDFEQYSSDARELPIRPDMQYIEVGSGLGGFLPYIIEQCSKKFNKKPIVIDPLDYNLANSLLSVGRKVLLANGFNSRIADNLEKLAERANFYANSDKINLLNCSLGEAIVRFPEIRNSADYVIDNCASTYYPEVEFPSMDENRLQENLSHINNMLSALLTSGGRIVGTQVKTN